MTLPAFVFGVLFATLFGALFHLIFGGGLGRMVILIVFSWIGFWLGHFLGSSWGWTFWSVGPLRMGMAAIGSLIFMVIAFWLSLVGSKTQTKN